MTSDSVLQITAFILLVIFLILPSIIIPLSIIIGYSYTHSKKYLETHKKQIEERKRLKEARAKEEAERNRGKRENIVSGEEVRGNSYIERMGAKGEMSINRILSREVVDRGWYLVKNIIISNKKNSSSQIDHVVINQSGIYVIETKNLAGLVYGNPENRYLKHRYSGSRRDYSLLNPLVQNRTHAKALSLYLYKHGIKMSITQISVIVGAAIKGDIRNRIYDPRGMLNTIRQKSLTTKYNSEQVKNAFNVLQNCCKNPTISAKEHIERVRKTHPNSTRRY